MFEKRSALRSLLAVAALAVVSFAGSAGSAGHTISSGFDRVLASAYDGMAFAFNAIASFGVRLLTSLMNIAPARADELRPLERIKLTASESHNMAMAKRERPVIFAGWRMSPST